MPVYVLLRVKPGAGCFQDFRFYQWPPSAYGEEGTSLAGVADDCIFIAEKLDAKWECTAPGAGARGQYGNGSISISGSDCIEYLTPMLGYCPSEEMRQAFQEGWTYDEWVSR